MSYIIADGLVYEPIGTKDLTVVGFVKGYSPDEVKIPPNVKNKVVSEISAGAFQSTQIKNVEFPFTIRIIRERAFAFCTNLKTVKIPFNWFEQEADTLLIETHAFSNCWNLREFCGNRTISVKAQAFEDCFDLIKLDGIRIQRLETASFLGCSSLSEAIFSTSVIMPSKCLSGWALRKATFLGDAVMSLDVIEHCKGNNIKIVCDEKSNVANLVYEGLKVECYGVKND